MMALFVIGGTIDWSSMSDYRRMIRPGRGGLEDILLLFLPMPKCHRRAPRAAGNHRSRHDTLAGGPLCVR
jgi:hypothetical protein